MAPITMNHGRAARLVAGTVLTVAAMLSIPGVLFSCSSSSSLPPRFPVTATPSSPEQSPVVFVPGVTGNSLRNERTGQLLWGSVRALLLPRDGGRSLVLPLSGGGDPIRAEGPLLSMRLLVWKREIYRPLAHLMATAGYRLGSLDEPRPGDGFFFFVYDWRQDNISTARQLASQLEGLRRARGQARLTVTLICQSNAARLCRYYTKYRDLEPEKIVAGIERPDSVSVDKLILVGTSNGGALRLLRELNRGRTYVPLLGRTWLPETLFTLRSLYEDLPSYTDDLFFDESGARLDVDLFDVANWERYGWSVFAEPVKKRLERRPRPGLFGDSAARRAFVAEQLERAMVLNRILLQDPQPETHTRYYVLGARSFDTPARALLRNEARGWRTYFAGDRLLRREPHLYSLAVEPGDGHATVASQNHLSPAERAALVEAPTGLGGGHFEVLLEPAVEAKILEYLAQ